jgi:hypothetical protein
MDSYGGRQPERDRHVFMRAIPYEIPASPEGARRSSQEGMAVSLNISSGGILLLIDSSMDVGEVLRVQIPSVAEQARTPTLGEVRWFRKVPFRLFEELYFAGLKFVL